MTLRRRGVYMSLNFSRKDIGIVDWAKGSNWKPHHSSTKRLIKLPKEKAQIGYNLLNAIIYDKFRVKVERREAWRGTLYSTQYTVHVPLTVQSNALYTTLYCTGEGTGAVHAVPGTKSV
jgi:hypothetical protein